MFVVERPFLALMKNMIQGVVGLTLLVQLQKTLSNMKMISVPDLNRLKLSVLTATPTWGIYLMMAHRPISDATELILHP